jgi:HEAT repeats
MNQEPRALYIPPSTLSFACLALLTVSTVLAQDRIIPAGQSNSKSTKKTHVATLHSSDTSEGSRVAITSDQSLNNYEAYRRGDRFYVKIPAADVSRAESARGRGFADVKSQRNGDSTVLSFRLEPGAGAHVEQRGNKLDVVVSVPGGTPGTAAANRPPNPPRPATSSGDASRHGKPKSNNSSAGGNKSNDASSGLLANSASGNANENSKLSSTTSSPANSNSASSAVTAPANATPDATLQSQASSNSETAPALGPQSSPIANSSGSASPATPAAARADLWTRAKERGHYWLLLAQLNPIPVALGAMLLVFIIMLLLFQRRRTRATRRIKTVTKSTESAVATAGNADVNNETETALGAETATVVGARPSPGTEASPVMAPVQPATIMAAAAASHVVSATEDSRSERVSRAGEEAKKVLAGDRYDEDYVGSEDPETRRLVGAELLSALVSRNAVRRERARAAFMKHGYFDDATRDLRIADSENERAAAARRLSFVNDREATPHLIGALGDPSPDVRRTVVEALMDVRDPAAIPALNALLQNEKDRKVPCNLIQKAIEACTTGPERETTAESDISPADTPPPATFNPDREVIEI